MEEDKSKIVTLQSGCFSRIAETMAEPTNPIPPVMRMLLRSGGAMRMGDSMLQMVSLKREKSKEVGGAIGGVSRVSHVLVWTRMV